MSIIPRTIRLVKSRAILAAATLVLSAAGISPPAEAFVVTIVKDTELKPYQEAIRGFKSECACATAEITLSNGEGTESILNTEPDAIVAVGTGAFKKVRTIRDLPIIYMMVIPSEAASPAENMFGVSMDISPDASLTAITELFPRARKIGVLHDPQHTALFVEEASESARRRGVELVIRTVRSPREVPALLEQMRPAPDVFWMLPDPTVVNAETVEYLLLYSFQKNVPVFSFSRKYVELGAVAALQASPFGMGAQAGEMARELSQGRKGPWRAYANRHRLIINRKVAAKMGYQFSPDTLKKAE